MPAAELTPEAIAALDSERQLAAVLELPDHLRDALWRVDSARIAAIDAPAGVIVAGMGGSGVGGDLAAAAFGDRLTRPLATVRDYGLPSWATPDHVVVCASYSGETEETLTCYEAAGALGAPRVVATTGGRLAEQARADGVPVVGIPAGLRPRAAVGYMFVVVAEVIARAQAGPGIVMEVDAAARQLEELATEWGAEAGPEGLPQQVAALLDGAAAVVYGADLTCPIALRWKTQINENAKSPAFHADLPEADHNDVVGWAGAEAAGRFAAVFLEDADQHPRTRRRIELTEDAVAPHAVGTMRVASRGSTRTERLFSLVLLGDLASIYLAVLRGVDPGPIDAIDRLKGELGPTG